MLNVSLVLQKTGRKDDVINMSTINPDEASILYKDGDRTGSYEFTMDRGDAYRYVIDLLIGLAHDADPFDYIQILPCTGPSILYHIWELEDDSIREVILGQVRTSLCGDVTYNRYN